MRMLRHGAVLLSSLGLMVAANGVPAHASTTDKPTGYSTVAHVKKRVPTPPDHYYVRAGVKFNDPYSRNNHSFLTIRRAIVRTINSTTKGDHIMIASWNIRSRAYVDALIGANKRGVGIRIVMDRGNANPSAPNPDYRHLAEAFAPTKARLPQNRSWIRRCVSSCRGRRGIAHSKFFLFDHVGARDWVTMYGSNNATDIAANSQWNDLYTIVGNREIYNDFGKTFVQMGQDHNLYGKAYVHDVTPNRTINFYPYQGPVATAAGDPDLNRLKQVKCSGATGGTGTNGHTKLRIAQDALLGDRGMAIARRLVTLKSQGCDIRFVYSLLGGNIRTILKNGHVPTLQYSYDRNRDGMYDIYLHMKDMAISGVFRGKTDTRMVVNGTANWTPVALQSDEVVAEITSASVTSSYINWIDYLWHHRPASWGPVNLAPVSSTGTIDRPVVTRDGRVVMRQVRTVDPYALMKKEGL